MESSDNPTGGMHVPVSHVSTGYGDVTSYNASASHVARNDGHNQTSEFLNIASTFLPCDGQADNFTCNFTFPGNSTVGDDEAHPNPLPLWQLIVWGVLVVFVVLMTIGGNLVVILSFVIERAIRQPTNYFIASLAVSDLLIGSISMPFYTVYLLTGKYWPLGKVLCDLWLSVDYTVCMTSIYTVFCITIDRFCSVKIPAKYRSWRTENKVLTIIACTWIVPILVFFITIFGWQYFVGQRTVGTGKCYVQYMEDAIFNCILQVGYFWITLVVMCTLYTGIYKVALDLQRKSEAKNRKMTSLVSMAGQTMTKIGIGMSQQQHIDTQKLFPQANSNSKPASAPPQQGASTTTSFSSSKNNEKEEDRSSSPAFPSDTDPSSQSPKRNSPQSKKLHKKSRDGHKHKGHTKRSGQGQKEGKGQNKPGAAVTATTSTPTTANCHGNHLSPPKNAPVNTNCIPNALPPPPSYSSLAIEDEISAVHCEDVLTESEPEKNSPSTLLLDPKRAVDGTDNDCPCEEVLDGTLAAPASTLTQQGGLTDDQAQVDLTDLTTNSDVSRSNCSPSKTSTALAIAAPPELLSGVRYIDQESLKSLQSSDNIKLLAEPPRMNPAELIPEEPESPVWKRRGLSFRSTDSPDRTSPGKDSIKNSTAPEPQHQQQQAAPCTANLLRAQEPLTKPSDNQPEIAFAQPAKQAGHHHHHHHQQQPQQPKGHITARRSSSTSLGDGTSLLSPTSVQAETGKYDTTITRLTKTDDIQPLSPTTSLSGIAGERNGRRNSSHREKHKAGSPFKNFVKSSSKRKRSRKQKEKQKSRSENRARKALRTITIILGAFVFCWTPWHIFSMIISFCPKTANGCIEPLLYDISYWLCYLNSPINPFCYAFANQQFKKTFIRILKLDWHRT